MYNIITGVLLLISAVSTLQWLMRLKEVQQIRKLEEWELASPIGILILLSVIAICLVW